jgi:hypothetical protein
MSRKIIWLLVLLTFTSLHLAGAQQTDFQLLATRVLGQSSSEEPTILVFKSTGQRQCQPLTLTRQAARTQLTQRGVRVLSERCGWDGYLYSAVCGGATGYLYIFEIPESQVSDAQLAGFSLFSELKAKSRHAHEGDCK